MTPVDKYYNQTRELLSKYEFREVYPDVFKRQKLVSGNRIVIKCETTIDLRGTWNVNKK